MTIERATRRLCAAALAVGLGVILLVGPMAPAASAATPVPAFDTTFATLLNTLRTSLGIGTLTVDDQLSAVARTWSEHQADTGVMAHNPAIGSQVHGWSKLGENVGYGSTVTQIFNALVASPPHMRNMSDSEFTRIGIGTVTDPQGRVWTTHVFMRPKPAAPAPAPAAPAPARTKPAAPVTTRTPRPAAVPAPTTVPVPATVPVTVPVATTLAAPAPVEVAGIAAPILVPAPLGDPVLTSSTPTPGTRLPVPLVAVAAVLSLLVLGSGGLLIRRTTSSARP